jgi:hypothetical protein
MVGDGDGRETGQSEIRDSYKGDGRENNSPQSRLLLCSILCLSLVALIAEHSIVHKVIVSFRTRILLCVLG